MHEQFYRVEDEVFVKFGVHYKDLRLVENEKLLQKSSTNLTEINEDSPIGNSTLISVN